MDKATNYFTHDSNARNDERLVRLRMKHGAAGYGVYFMLLERLREEATYSGIIDYNVLAYDLRVDAALVKSVIEDFGLFVCEGKRFYSESFLRRMALKDEQRKKRAESGRLGMQARWGKNQQPAPKKPAPAPTPASTDNEELLKRFFAKGNARTLEALLMNLGLKPTDLGMLQDTARQVVDEWKLSEKRHENYTDWSQHLISTMRIKLKAKEKGNGRNTSARNQQRDEEWMASLKAGFDTMPD